MKRRIPGLHATNSTEEPLEGLFLVRVEWASYRWHLQKAFLSVRFVVLEPSSFQRRSFSGRFYCIERALWKLNWFLRDFGYDQQLLADDQVDEKALVNLRGVVRTSHVTLMGRHIRISRLLHRQRIGMSSPPTLPSGNRRKAPMVYSHTQISHTFAARAAIGIDISMAGERRTLGPAWSSAAALKMLWLPIFVRGLHGDTVPGMGRPSRCSFSISQRRILGPDAAPGRSPAAAVCAGRSD